MARSPRPPGPVRALGPRGLLSPEPKAFSRRSDRRWAPQSPRSPRRQCGPADLTKPGGCSKGANQAGRGLHDTARSGPGPDPGPTQAPPRGRAGAQPGPAGPASPHLAPSSPLLFCLPLSWSPPLRRAQGQAGLGLPSTEESPGARTRSERAGARTQHTHSAPEAMARASPGRRLWRPAGVTATRGSRRPTGPGLGSSGRGASRSDKPAGGLPLASSQRHPGGGRAEDAGS